MKFRKIALVSIWLASFLLFGVLSLAFGWWRTCYGLARSGVSITAQVTNIRTVAYGKYHERYAFWTQYEYEVQNRTFRGHQELDEKPQGPTIPVTYDSHNPAIS